MNQKPLEWGITQRKNIKPIHAPPLKDQFHKEEKTFDMRKETGKDKRFYSICEEPLDATKYLCIRSEGNGLTVFSKKKNKKYSSNRRPKKRDRGHLWNFFQQGKWTREKS